MKLFVSLNFKVVRELSLLVEGLCYLFLETINLETKSSPALRVLSGAASLFFLFC